MSELLIKAALAYLLGSIVGSLLIRRLTGGADIRSLGSGNAGATNALRTLGMKVAVWVLIIDLGKGWIATARLAPWALPGIPAAPPELAAWCLPVCGIGVMLGHVYPLWYGLRGGKGMATLVGAVLGISPWLRAVAVVVWIARHSPTPPLLTFAILAALLIVFTHRSNIARLLAGTESRAGRLWLFGTRRGTTG
jgi:glycerol-3-phosphate acyltransferase PlsY